jgi:hypothetical protein
MSKAEKILEKMKNSKHGWTSEDLHKVYIGYGFKFREGGKHIIYYHPEHHELMATVARQGVLVVGYIQTALKLIDQLEKLRGDQER